MYKGFEFKPLQEGDYIVNSFYRDNDGSLLYTPINSDTVYQFTSPGTAYAKYVICQEKVFGNFAMKDYRNRKYVNLLEK